jgi:hypothetical protein
MRLTTTRYFTPSGRSIQDLGITRDIPVADSTQTASAMQPLLEVDPQHPMLNSSSKQLPQLPPRTDLPAIAKFITNGAAGGVAQIRPDQALDGLPASVGNQGCRRNVKGIACVELKAGYLPVSQL